MTINLLQVFILTFNINVVQYGVEKSVMKGEYSYGNKAECVRDGIYITKTISDVYSNNRGVTKVTSKYSCLPFNLVPQE